MKLSEAVILGSTFVPARYGELRTKDSGGCALGMALQAVGSRRYKYRELIKRWPWLQDRFVVPCQCVALLPPMTLDGYELITHIFDLHVVIPINGKWSFDQLVEWISSVEPKEDSPSDLTLRELAQTAAGILATSALVLQLASHCFTSAGVAI